MRRILFAILVFVSFSASAQSYQFEENFDSNNNGWTEVISKKGESIVKDGTLKLRSKNETGFFESHCFTDIDVKRNFEIKCEVKVKEINDESTFGVILDYIDEGNYIVFCIFEGNARLIRFEDGREVGSISNSIKLKSKKKTTVDLSIKSTFQKLVFEVNGMKAIEARYLPLTSSGIGFYVYGNQTLEFDNLKIVQ
jgi:hypothetical protein